MNLYQDPRHIVDLSHRVHPDMQTFPVDWHKKVEFEKLGTLQEVGRNTTQVHIGTHSGTHIDAPSHFLELGKSISDFEISTFLGEATYFDLSFLKPKDVISVDVLERVLAGRICSRILIFNLGWSSRYGSGSYYSDQPFFNNESAEWILAKKPKLIGYDIAMPDDPLDGRSSDCDSPMHKKFMHDNILLLENLNISESLPLEFFLIALPMNLDGLDGSPVRCVGIF